MNITNLKQAHVLDIDSDGLNLAIDNNYIFLIDFCDLYVLDKNDLEIVKVFHIGNDLTSDLVTVRSDSTKAYISMRNGRMVIFNILTFTYGIIKVDKESSWEHEIVNEYLLICTIDGKIIKINKNTYEEIQTIELSKKNTYSLYYNDSFIYSVSQDMSIKRLTFSNLEVINTKKNIIKGMSKILGIYNNYLITADGRISFFNKDTIELEGRMAFPTGHFNKGIILFNNLLIGSDYHSVYVCDLNA